ncbi:MAG: alpha/beta fold hydrolase [Pseudomonadota bacterium]
MDLIGITPDLIGSLFQKPGQARKQRVLVVPGFGADDRFTWPLRKYLQSLGYDVMGWGLGTNKAGMNLKHRITDLHPRWNLEPLSHYRGEAGVPYLADMLINKVDQLASDSEDQIALIGWSLGGYIAREVARERPELVSQVITLGSPVVGGPKYTLAAQVFAKRNYNLNWIEQCIRQREVKPIEVPVTAVISTTDGVVGYHAALDHFSPKVTHIEMDAAHIGLPYNRQVWRIVTNALEAME